VKANDVDAVMACVAFSNPADAAAARIVVQRDVAIHRLVEAALARWGERAFADGGLEPNMLAVSNSTIDRWLKVIEKAETVGLGSDRAQLNGWGEPAIPRANWHGPLVEMTIYLPYVRVDGQWKVDQTHSEGESGRDHENEQAASLMKDLTLWNQRVEQLARETEAGWFESVAELKAALASAD
jgi:hypothetical protein